MDFLCDTSPSDVFWSCFNGSCSAASLPSPDNRLLCLQGCVSSVLGSRCSPYEPSGVVDTVFVNVPSGGIELAPSAVDSLNRFFLDGFGGGVMFSLPYLAAVFGVLLASFILVSAVKNS